MCVSVGVAALMHVRAAHDGALVCLYYSATQVEAVSLDLHKYVDIHSPYLTDIQISDR